METKDKQKYRDGAKEEEKGERKDMRRREGDVRKPTRHTGITVQVPTTERDSKEERKSEHPVRPSPAYGTQTPKGLRGSQKRNRIKMKKE